MVVVIAMVEVEVRSQRSCLAKSSHLAVSQPNWPGSRDGNVQGVYLSHMVHLHPFVDWRVLKHSLRPDKYEVHWSEDCIE